MSDVLAGKNTGLKHKVQFGKAEDQQDTISVIKTEVASALMEAGLPGAISIDLSALGMKGVNGRLDLKPTISKKDGRVMYNCAGKDVTIGGVAVKVMGNWMLPTNGFCVDGETHKAYVMAIAERDAKRKQKQATGQGKQTEADLDEGETTE